MWVMCTGFGITEFIVSSKGSVNIQSHARVKGKILHMVAELINLSSSGFRAAIAR